MPSIELFQQFQENLRSVERGISTLKDFLVKWSQGQGQDVYWNCGADWSLLRISVKLKEGEHPQEMCDLVDRLNIYPQMYWKSRNHGTEFWGLDASFIVETDLDSDWQKMRQIHLLDPEIIFMGAKGFTQNILANKANSEWEGLLPSYFMAPFLMWKNDGGHWTLHCQFLYQEQVSPSFIVKEILDRLLNIQRICHTLILQNQTAQEQDQLVPQLEQQQKTVTTFFPDYPQWEKQVQKALSTLMTLDKVVLARKVVQEIGAGENNWEGWQLLQRLALVDDHSFLFYLTPKKQMAFIGRSPELLFAKVHQKIKTEAIAGTRPRNNSDLHLDTLWGEELLNSHKERLEHNIVVEALLQTCAQVCHEYKADRTSPSILRLEQLQHLYTSISGTLLPDISLRDLLALFHPTPAVGGYPKEKSLQLIDQLEKFSRGLYAGPIGIFNGHEAEFAVAIRSALIRQKHLHVYAGCGLVQGSQALQEWQETSNKLKNLLRPFGLALEL